MKDLRVADLYWALDDHDFIVIAGSDGYDDFTTSDMGIVHGHAYSVFGISSIHDSEGEYITDLVHLRNPWGFEMYTGPYSDESALWTPSTKA